MEQKSTINEKSLEGFKNIFKYAEEEKRELKDRTIKITESEEYKDQEPKGFVGYHQVNQHTYYGSPRRRGQEQRNYLKK